MFTAMVRIAVEGAQKAKKDVENIREPFMQLAKALGATEKELDKLDKAFAKAGKAQQQAGRETKNVSNAQKENTKNTQAASKSNR
jgi:hypothetical protein